MSDSIDRITVAVAVIVNDHGDVLMTRRHAHAHQGGKWEFPGGKLEQGESVADALARELLEELGIVPVAPQPLLRVSHDYADRAVLLDTWLVEQWQGEAQAREGQPMRWVDENELAQLPLPPANRPIVEALRLRSRSR